MLGDFDIKRSTCVPSQHLEFFGRRDTAIYGFVGVPARWTAAECGTTPAVTDDQVWQLSAGRLLANVASVSWWSSEETEVLAYPHALAELTKLAEDVPPKHARTVRELVQKEYENDIKSHDGLMSRGNTMLGSTGVGLSLLVGFSKEGTVDTGNEQSLLMIALALALLSVVLVLFSLRLRGAATVMPNLMLFGDGIPASDSSAAADPTKADEQELRFTRHHELRIALQYAVLRIELEHRHRRRATWLRVGQVAYVGFLLAASGFAVSIPL